MNATSANSGSNSVVDTSALSRLKSLQSLDASRQNDRNAQLREVSRQFAGLFLGEVFKAMRGDQDTSGIGFGGSGERIFQEMADEAVATEATNSQSYGLADLVYQSMMRRSSVFASPSQDSVSAGAIDPQTPVMGNDDAASVMEPTLPMEG